MRRTILAVILVVAIVLLVAELTMDVTPADRTQLYLIFGVMALTTFVAAVLSLRLAGRFHSLRTSLTVIAYAAVVVTGAAVAVAALTMFIEPHDLTLVLVAIGLGVGLGSVIAGAVARPLTSDLEAISRTAQRVGAGDLSARTGVSRNDELGRAAAALDETIATLQASEIERRNLLSAIGHDLRTPMGSMQAAVEFSQSHAPALKSRTLLLVAGEDRLVDASGSAAFHAKLAPGVGSLRAYASFYHEIFNEVDAERVFADIRTWLDELREAR